MDVSMLEMALKAAEIMLDPLRLAFLFLGVIVGLVLGVIPGLGGLVGTALLLPFAFSLDPYAGLAMLIGLGSVTATSDSIPAILFGVPGTVGSAATVLDGNPMARRGEASRAFGAAFTASMLGGLFGAVLLGLSVPFLRPLMLNIATPELLSLTIFGLTLVAALGGRNAFKGLVAACIGLLLSTIGEDTQAGELRWTFDTLYLWDGLPIVPVALGLFAIPELADMAIRRASVTSQTTTAGKSSQFHGVRDVLRHPFLMLRCSAIGSLIGAVPGLGAAVVDWIAYGHAARTEKNASQTFGKGDVRGLIASESSNNAKEGGSLVTTIAFGVPGSASMALLLGAFVVYGIVPGPEMLNERLDVTYSLVWSVAVANVLGAGLCFLFARQLAKLALVRPGILVPVVLAITFIGAFQGSRDWGDLYVLLGMGALGFFMKRLGWPRPPLILGFVLGVIFERYMFITTELYGISWLTRPFVAIVLLISLYGLLAPALRRWMAGRRVGVQERPRLKLGLARDVNVYDALFAAAFVALFTTALIISSGWAYGARLIPQIISWTGVVAGCILLVSQLFVRFEAPGGQVDRNADGLQFDLSGEFEGLARGTVVRRALEYFGWSVLFIAAAWIIGLLPAVAVFVAGYMRFTSRESTTTALVTAAIVTLLSYLLFHWLLVIPWPDAWLGDVFPDLRAVRALRLF